MYRLIIGCVKIVFFTVAICVHAQVEQDTIVAEGMGRGVNEKEALIAAKRDAIEKGIGQLLISQTEIENFQLKRDQIISKTIGSVKQYQVIGKKEEAGLIEIHIKAVLQKNFMRNDLAAFHILIESMDKPRVMVIIAENNLNDAKPTNRTAETVVTRFLKDPYEFDMVDHSASQKIRESEQQMASIVADPVAAASIGTDFGAEVLIAGEAVATEAENINLNLGGMKSVQADVTLRAINCSTAKLINSVQARSSAVHINPTTAGSQAIAKATQTAIKELLDAIVKDWQNLLNNGMSLSVSVSGVGSYRTKTDVVKTISALDNVVAVRERSWDGQSTIMQMEVVFKGNVDGFCERVDGLKMKSGKGSLSVSGAKGNKIALAARLM